MSSIWVSAEIQRSLRLGNHRDNSQRFASSFLTFAAIATTLQCLIADEEMNDGNGEYMDSKLKDFVDKHAQEDDEYNG